MRRLLASFCALGFALLSAWPAFASRKEVTDDVYIWQRRWTPALLSAMQMALPVVKRWRVLAAEVDPKGEWHTVKPDFEALRVGNRQILATIRIEGRSMPTADMIPSLLGVIAAWRAAGVSPAALELDFDAPTSKLQGYAYFLRRLRPALPADLPLVITALPTWLNSKELPLLLAQADESVLQVHAVGTPYDGLFQPWQARVWAHEFASRTDKPWRIALPSYGTRAVWNAQGRLIAVDSEASSLVAGDEARELFAAPKMVAGFRDELQAKPPKGFAGFVWFRLPTAEDRRAWSLDSFLIVLREAPLHEKIERFMRQTPQPDVYDLFFRNTGNVDAVLPSQLEFAPRCDRGDGANGFRWRRTVTERYTASRLQRDGNDALRLRPGTMLPIGWIHCPPPETGPEAKKE